MADSRKLNLPLVLALGTLGFFASSALIGTFNYFRWYIAIPEASPDLPIQFWLQFGKTALQALVGAAGFTAVLYSKQRRTSQLFAMACLGAFLALLLASWPLLHSQVIAGDAPPTAHLVRAASALWHFAIIGALLSNYAFERTAGTTHDVS